MEQSNSIRVRKSISKADLKSRLYDKGISLTTMPSVKRTIQENVKPFAAKLSIQNKPPMYQYKAVPPPQIEYDQIMGSMKQQQQQQQYQQSSQTLYFQGKHMKSISSDPFLKTSDKFLKSTVQQQRDISPNDQYLDTPLQGSGINIQATDTFRPQTSNIIGGDQFRIPSQSQLNLHHPQNAQNIKQISNPQFTTLNMAPYSRPQTQAFGFRNQKLQSDPSKKVIKTSEEITSITGMKTMTALGPAAMNRPKTSNQDYLMKRCQSNKQLKRRILGGQKSEMEEKTKQLIDRIREEDDERIYKMINNSPNRKVNEKIIGGNQEVTDEILRSHYLMAKIRGKVDTPTIYRPSTTDGMFFGGGGSNQDLRLPSLSTSGGVGGASSQLRQYQGGVNSGRYRNKYGGGGGFSNKSPLNLNSKIYSGEQIDEHANEEDFYEDASPNKKKEYLQQQQLDSTKSEKIITNITAQKNKNKSNQPAKMNDLDKLITLLQNQPDDDGYFIYLKQYEESKDPYDLRPLVGNEQVMSQVIPQKPKNDQQQQQSQQQQQQTPTQQQQQKITPSQLTNKGSKFYTLSKKGITTYINDEPIEYISLTDWLIERNFFQQISEKKFFSQFRRWKIVRMWRRNILQKKREEVKNNLIEKLFHLDDVFGKILMDHRGLCKDMEQFRIVDLSQPGHEVFTIGEFAATQTRQREQIVNRIEETSEQCRSMFVKGINEVLEELRQKINDQNEDEENHKKEYMRGGQNQNMDDDNNNQLSIAKEKKSSLNSDPVFEQLGFKHNLKYGPRSKLRRACSRFLRFSYLLDFLALDSLSNIYIQSVKDTIKKLKYLSNLPVDFELKPLRTEFGGPAPITSSGGGGGAPQARRETTSMVKELPFFFINGKFEENDIPMQNFVKEKILIFEPPPIGNSKVADFDPTVHLELVDKHLNLDEQIALASAQESLLLDGEEDDYNKIERIRVVNLHKIWLTVIPQKQDFSSLLNECFQEGLECLKHFERWSRHEDLLKYVKVLESWDDKVCDEWDPPDDNNLNCEEWLQENPYFLQQSKKVNKYINKAYSQVFKFFTQLEGFLYQFWQNKQLGKFDIIQDERLKNSVEILPILLQRFQEQKEMFSNYIPEQRDLGMIRVNFKDIKGRISPNPENCFNLLKKMLPQMVRQRISDCKQWLLSQIEKIRRVPSNVDSYVAQIKDLEYIDSNFQKIKDKIELNNQIFHICVLFEIESKEDKNQKFLTEAYSTMNNLSNAISEANEQAGKRKESMIKKIQSKIPKLKQAVDEFNEFILNERFLDVNSNLYEILNDIEKYEQICQELVDKSKRITDFQQTLEMDFTNFDYVEDTRTAMSFRSLLWKSRNEWQDLVEKWQKAEFEQIEVSEISSKADLFTKIVFKCERNLEKSTAVEYLKKLVMDFKETMPVVEALGNERLGETTHWAQIKKVMNCEDYPLQERKFTLEFLISKKVVDFQEDIINISVTATQENILRLQLEEIKLIWNTAAFKVAPVAGKGEAYKLIELDKLQFLLDESLSNMSNITASRFVKSLEADAIDMQNKLFLYLDTIEQWKEFQRNWLYLDSILQSKEIKASIGKDIQEYDQACKGWIKLMKEVYKQGQIKKHCSIRTNYNNFIKWNQTMDKIQKLLEDYLETKRVQFPRFYFLSNDELLQILANSQDVDAVQKHVNKCFDNISRLHLKDADIDGMISQEGEMVLFTGLNVKVKSGVENWMKQVQEKMVETLKKKIKDCHKEYYEKYTGEKDKTRKEWVLSYCGQAIAVVSQITWTEGCENAINDLDENPYALTDHLDLQKAQLDQLTDLIRGPLDPIPRKILVALITTDIHGRDIVRNLFEAKVQSSEDFAWKQQLRYYLPEDKSEEGVIVRQVNSTIPYGYEYMGATSRLVITPLTDRCWITITGAMSINLGAAPAGPAGTGKTESTKDLAKALGIYCVVFNCSEQIEYKMMARLFSGLAQSGAWSCLDEFNRIDVEVLSVIAQQLLDIKQAKSQNKQQFFFNGKMIDLKKSCGVFVTMNPGYAGRTELPDNLKVLFRPVSMMIPAYGLIAEIMLSAEGFQNSEILSKKMVQLYKLASEQLSQQDHYDFGMRAVKSVLVMAGSLKRDYKTLNEDVVLIRAMRDSNIPKFLADDIPLFQALIQDLFPNISIPEENQSDLASQIKKTLKVKNLQEVEKFERKVLQLFDTFNVRFGVMIVGPTGAGKTTCFRVLQSSMSALRAAENADAKFQDVTLQILNPKSISMGELYGEENEETKEWTDGLASKIIREFTRVDDGKEKQFRWTVFDGPVDALWIENMNTVLDDNMTLCLANGERIKLRWNMRMLFEVQDLAVASPATVSRCGMVYMTPSDLGWEPYFRSWVNEYLVRKDLIHEEGRHSLEDMFIHLVERCFKEIRDECAGKYSEPMPTVPVQIVYNICNFLEFFIKTKKDIPRDDKKEWEKKINYYLGQSIIWAFGSTYHTNAISFLDNKLRDICSKMHHPASETVFDYFYQDKEQKVLLYSKEQFTFDYDPKLPFFSLLVPTTETIKYTALLDILISINKPVFFTGNTGVGKSIIIQKFLSNNQEKYALMPIILNFSAQTNSLQTQQSIESKLDRKRGKQVLGAKGNQTTIVFIDDVNMPQVEKFGAQPPIELLRQIIDQRGFYDRPEFYWKEIERFNVICGAAHPSGGRSQLSARFMRHFHIFNLPDPSEVSLKKIFDSILERFLQANLFLEPVKKCSSMAVSATNELYSLITTNLLPIPAKFHYTFNLRDVAKVFQGILMTKPTSVPDAEVFCRLWIHECQRVFYDRLINEQDRAFFTETICDLLKTKFKYNWKSEDLFSNKNTIIFSKLLRLDSDDKIYEEVKNKDKLFKVLEDKMGDYNLSNTSNKIDLVFFDDAINHICRISRILSQPRGNAMLIGVSGCGKQSLTRLCSYMLEYKCFQIKLSKNYKPSNFRDDIKVQMLDAGCDAIQNTFLMTDTQIAREEFLEDVNNILNTGEITNLYVNEDFERMRSEDLLSKALQQLRRFDTFDNRYQLYIERLRDNFHIILCMSPVGDQLRIRCRKFPSLVNCCTLDWFDNWPEEALLNVSSKFMKNVENLDTAQKNKLGEMFPQIHKSVEEMSVKFFQSLRRTVYITPKSYLDGINLFLSQLRSKRTEQNENINRLSNGIQKLELTNNQIAELKVKLIELVPKLQKENDNANIQAEKIKDNKQIASRKEMEVESEAAMVEVEALKINQLKKEAEVELTKAMPALEDAQRAVNELQKDDVTELKNYPNPAQEVQNVLKCILIYFGQQKTDWNQAKKIMADIKFLDKLKEYNKEEIPVPILQKVSKIVLEPDFNIPFISNKSRAAGGLAKWCKAVREYCLALKIVRPKEQKMREMTEKFSDAMREVEMKQRALQDIKDHLNKLEMEFQQTSDYIEQLDRDKNLCEKRLENAGKLISLLGDEGERWKRTVEELMVGLGKIVGNVFIAANMISYVGPFTGPYRDQLMQTWIEMCNKNKILVSDKYSLVNTLGDLVMIRTWGLNSLPSDQVSIDNGIIATKTQRWPLMIDPQTQANTWIKKMNRERGLRSIKISADSSQSSAGSNYQKELELCLGNGYPALIEDIYQEIDPGLDTILTKSIYKEDNLEKITFNDKPIIYDKNFQLFITTKLPNPHFLPEICIKLTIINFTVTFEGLQEQLLADVVMNEAPQVEIQRDKLVMQIAESENELTKLENKILRDLASSNQDTILDNQELIDTLEISKKKSKIIKESLEQSEIVNETISQTRNSYKAVSVRGSILYFVISDLSFIDPMYQNSLSYVKKLFNEAMANTVQQKTLEERIIALENQITKTLYINICRGLFEEHKLIYSFLMCSSIQRKSGIIDDICWNYLLRGAGIFNKENQPPREESIMNLVNENQWDLVYCLQENVKKSFPNFCQVVVKNSEDWEEYIQNDEENYLEQIPCGYSESLTLFERLLILKIFKSEKILFALSRYVQLELGQMYAESPIASMDALFNDSDKKTPIIFVLSQGADPTEQVIQFAKKQQYSERFQYKSLGQGQKVVAQAMIEQGKLEGNWVLLQNCHLYKSWMPSLEEICQKFNEDEGKIHPDFRLILTSMPAEYFPVAILQNGLKMTTEPPRGIKANLKRSYNNLITEEIYNQCHPNQPNTQEYPDYSYHYKTLLFGLCFFHAIVQERRKFGPLGWNIRYEFNDSDLDTSITMLNNFLIDSMDIPWDAMKYMTGQINYGGRVTDDWDRHLLLKILDKFYNEEIVDREDDDENYIFSASGNYFVPRSQIQDLDGIKEYIDSLPMTEQPEVFGMHANANIAYQQQESEKIITTILNVQPRIATGSGGQTSDEIILDLCKELKANVPENLERSEAHKELFKINSKGLYHCLATVLLQEMEKYNKLLNKIKTTRTLLKKAIKGEVLMSQELDLMYSSFLKNQVPPNWQEVSYPSLKPLSSWIKDLRQRIDFMRKWLQNNYPSCYWLSGFFFPHGFMTGTLQTFARNHIKAIDLLEFSFKVLENTDENEITKPPQDGIYIYGLFIEGARWSFKDKCLEEQNPGEMTFQMPLIHFLPRERKEELKLTQQQISQNQNSQQAKKKQEEIIEEEVYDCPCYKTSVRAGVLSTTGQSTNFILAIQLPCSDNEPPEHWTLRGTALLTMLND